jgi:DNA-binding transcriptional ArsR family regulator
MVSVTDRPAAETSEPGTASDDADELPEPPAELLIGDPEQLKALGGALRLQILEVMGRRARHGWSVRELAAAVGGSQTRLYHHVKLLEARGLLRLAGTQVVSGIVERRYQLAARSYRLDRALTSGPDRGAAVALLLDAAMTETRRQIMAGIAAGTIDPSRKEPGRQVMIYRNRLRLGRDRIEPFKTRLQALLDEEDAGEAADAIEHGLLITFYPTAGAGTPDR